MATIISQRLAFNAAHSRVFRNTSRSQASHRPLVHLRIYSTKVGNQRLQSHVVSSSGRPNPYGSGSSEEDEARAREVLALAMDLALPAAGIFAVTLLAGPFLGGIVAMLGLPIAVTAIAAALGILDRVAAAVGTTPVVAASIVASTTFGILLIPTFLKFGLFALGGYFIYNLLFGEGRPLGPPEPEIDARNVIIDVVAETVDEK